MSKCCPFFTFLIHSLFNFIEQANFEGLEENGGAFEVTLFEILCYFNIFGLVFWQWHSANLLFFSLLFLLPQFLCLFLMFPLTLVQTI